MKKEFFVPRLLGYLGLLPFILSSILVWVPEYHNFAIQSITLYAAVILTFIGGVHWGLAIQACKTSSANERDQNDRALRNQFIFSILPSLVAWLAVLIAQPYSLLIMAIGFVTFWISEKILFSKALEPWYSTLRNHLTIVATLCIVMAWLGTQ